MKKQVWKNILQFIVTIATSIISAIGVTSVSYTHLTLPTNSLV